MAELVKVKMLRAVGGYAVNDEREVSQADAKRLEARGIVRVLKGKAAAAPENKMDAAPANKAAPKQAAK
ncbi:MAG: hypothetical protein EON90_02095 [Brevundimonas sp.]|nr:MAG: hypothetical protein EON90_02095 [Brevundimonas sp.]